jgi:tryptophan synthase beta chain
MKRFFGDFGGAYIPESFVPILEELEAAFEKYKNDREFREEFAYYMKDYVGRPSPLYFAEHMSEDIGCRIYLKREDLNHTGAHKINNAIGQILLAKRMGKKRIIAETGAGQHGVATATACAVMGLECAVYMGAVDVKRQALNVFRMELLGTKVVSVTEGSSTLKDAINAAFRDWLANVENTYYLFGTAAGPHPYPTIVRDFQSIIGNEAREQVLQKEGRLPDYAVACIGGGSNAIGLFHAFREDPVKFVGVEAGGIGEETGENAATLRRGKFAVLHGSRSKVLVDDYGQVLPVHSISAGLDYPGVGPELAYFQKQGKLEAVSATDKEALEGFRYLSLKEGIIPALESSHAVAWVLRNKGRFQKDEIMIINISGRGDKDVHTIYELFRGEAAKE